MSTFSAIDIKKYYFIYFSSFIFSKTQYNQVFQLKNINMNCIILKSFSIFLNYKTFKIQFIKHQLINLKKTSKV